MPQHREVYCSLCGEETITGCSVCSVAIRGIYRTSIPGAVIPDQPFKAPSYCYNCGAAFPWTERRIQAARELADEIDDLSDAEKEKLKNSIPDLTKDTPQTTLATARFKKLIEKVRGPVTDGLKDIVKTIATEAVKKGLGF